LTRSKILSLLEALGRGELSADQAADALAEPSPRLGFAHLDLERPRRTGLPEVVFGEGKTAEQIAALLSRLHAAGQVAIATRVDGAKAAAVRAAVPEVQHIEMARVLLLPAPGEPPRPAVRGPVGVVCAGTSDLFVAEEAAVVLEAFGHPVERVRDVGVAGIHRLLDHLDRLRACSVLVVVAGMEGALPSVVAGLVGRPVIAVPTSVGYGASFGGVAALLGMLNSCAPGLSVVNIDNGFGAACQAALINLAG
jgi:NCAIR mutase (PurE)-related protein